MKTPITYYGGKQTMLRHILPLIPKHTVYTESFCGGCAVLFAKPLTDCEVINDTNRALVNFYLVAKRHYQLLKAEIDATLHSRYQYTRAVHIMQYPDYFSPAQWAWAVWVLSKLSFASRQDGSFGYDRCGQTAKKVIKGRDEFTELICKRLENVTVENDDAKEVLKRYDCPGAFHFVDPPYVGSDCGHYADSFNENDLQTLLELLTTLQGSFMLTMFPHDAIASYASRHDWHIHRITRTITAAKKAECRRRQEEWMVCNYLPKAAQQALF